MGHLHIYGQIQWHAEAFILGDTEALTALRNAIDKALEVGRGHSSAFAGDGEGYNIAVVNLPTDHFDKLAVPYTDTDGAQETRSNAVWPTDIPDVINAIKDAIEETEKRWEKS